MDSIGARDTNLLDRQRPRAVRATTLERHHAVRWFVAGAALAFLVAYLGADVLELHHDLYYLVYVTVVGLFLASFLAHMRSMLAGMFRPNLGWSLGIGAIVAVALIQTVLRDPSTTHPSGVFFGFELLWRGVAYGAMDALTLFVFPAAVAYILMKGDRSGVKRRLGFAALTLALSLIITASYHLGYGQFRGGDLVKPEVGALFGNVPAMSTGNPLGALIAHSTFHVAANVHAYRSGVFLPPDLDGYADHLGGPAALLVAFGWILLAGVVVWWQRQRLFALANNVTASKRK